jgi:hypothetical protein
MAVIWIVLLVGLILLALLGVGVLVLVKICVIASYAVKEESPEGGDYGLDQSHEPSGE